MSSRTSFAYTALLMKGESYLPGLKALYASLKATSTPYPLVLMVTPDVDKEKVKEYADVVKEVPYLSYSSLPMATAKQRSMYDDWMDVGYSKWNALSLTEYSKVLLLDLDIVVLSSLDGLFDITTPAATFSNAWAFPYAKGKKALYNPYLAAKHGQKVNRQAVKDGLDKSFVLIGTTVLLSPSQEDYDGFCKWMASHDKPYGHSKCFSMRDEQSLTEYYSVVKKKDWYHINQSYNCIPWHEKEWLEAGDKPAVAHFFGEKPWNMEKGQWEDLAVWWKWHDAACRQ